MIPTELFIHTRLFVYLYRSSICLNPNELPNQFYRGPLCKLSLCPSCIPISKLSYRFVHSASYHVLGDDNGPARVKSTSSLSCLGPMAYLETEKIDPRTHVRRRHVGEGVRPNTNLDIPYCSSPAPSNDRLESFFWKGNGCDWQSLSCHDSEYSGA